MRRYARYSQDSGAPTHLRRLVDAARRDDLDAARRARVAVSLGLMPASALALPSSPPLGPTAPTVPPASGALARTTLARTLPRTILGGLVVASVAVLGAGTWMSREVAPRDGTSSSSNHAPQGIATPPAAPALPVTRAEKAPADETPSIDVSDLPPADRADTTATPAAKAKALHAANPDTRVPDTRVPDTRVPRAGAAGAGATGIDEDGIAKSSAMDPASDVGKGTAAPAGDLREELSALDAVRRMTASGEPRTALTLLDTYEKKFPSGKLREEALVLRIEALAANGERESAERLAKLLFAASPYTPYAARVRAALGRRSEEP